MDEQVDLLENQKTMSEYDVKLANARLEILQKQIALENARQNKNQMKLRRDTQGNYKYVYAADQDDVNQKQQDLLDSQFDAYEISKEGHSEAYDRGISLYQNYIEQRSALEMKYANDETKLMEELAKLNADYLRAAQANAEDLQDTYNGMIMSVEWMANTGTDAVRAMTEDVLDALSNKTQESLEAVGVPWSNAINTAISDFDRVQDAVNKTTKQGVDAAKEYTTAISGDNGVGAIVGKEFGQATDAIKQTTGATKELGAETQNLNKIMAAELGSIDKAKEKIEAYRKELEKTKNSASAVASKLSSVEDALAKQTRETNDWHAKYEAAQTTLKGIENGTLDQHGNSKNAGGGQAGRPNLSLNSIVHLKPGTEYWNDSYASEYSEGKRYPKAPYFGTGADKDYLITKVVSTDRAAPYLVEYYKDGQVWGGGWVNANQIIGFDTGGYTGDWGRNGKLAMLHEKELVLNKDDTQNILAAVDTLRYMISKTKQEALYNNTVEKVNNWKALSQRYEEEYLNPLKTNGVQQRLEITAEFPNVTVAEEIKQALLGLADSAMQYSYREV